MVNDQDQEPMNLAVLFDKTAPTHTRLIALTQTFDVVLKEAGGVVPKEVIDLLYQAACEIGLEAERRISADDQDRVLSEQDSGGLADILLDGTVPTPTRLRALVQLLGQEVGSLLRLAAAELCLGKDREEGQYHESRDRDRRLEAGDLRETPDASGVPGHEHGDAAQGVSAPARGDDQPGSVGGGGEGSQHRSREDGTTVAVTLSDGSPVTPDHREIDPFSGQQKGYVVLSAEERAKGFVRPVRDGYLHVTCGGLTTMSRAIAETFARDPKFYTGTFCARCRKHFPLTEFRWEETGEWMSDDQGDEVRAPDTAEVGGGSAGVTGESNVTEWWEDRLRDVAIFLETEQHRYSVAAYRSRKDSEPEYAIVIEDRQSPTGSRPKRLKLLSLRDAHAYGVDGASETSGEGGVSEPEPPGGVPVPDDTMAAVKRSLRYWWHNFAYDLSVLSQDGHHSLRLMGREKVDGPWIPYGGWGSARKEVRPWEYAVVSVDALTGERSLVTYCVRWEGPRDLLCAMGR